MAAAPHPAAGQSEAAGTVGGTVPPAPLKMVTTVRRAAVVEVAAPLHGLVAGAKGLPRPGQGKACLSAGTCSSWYTNMTAQVAWRAGLPLQQPWWSALPKMRRRSRCLEAA